MKKSIAGIGVGSGRKESFYFSVLEFFEKENRWFLKTCQQLREFEYPETEDSLLSWINDFDLSTVIVDFPLSMPPCFDCELDCPGSVKCPQLDVIEKRKLVNDLLQRDQDQIDNNPKKYEEERLNNSSLILSKALKRKLKKGFIPYWNRVEDVDLWIDYHDDLMKYFKQGLASFGNENSIQVLRFKYLERHFPKSVKVLETNYEVTLLELKRHKIINAKDLGLLGSFDSSDIARETIIKKLEKHFDLFIYEKDRETLIKKPRAFKSLLLTLAGLDTSNIKDKKFFVTDLNYLKT